jgi:hypothetical protein
MEWTILNKVFYYAGRVVGRFIKICIYTPMIAFLYRIM